MGLNNEEGGLNLQQLEWGLDWLENMIATANPKDLPYLNAAYQKIFDRLVELDLRKEKNSQTE
jgi:hypothetical protein